MFELMEKLNSGDSIDYERAQMQIKVCNTINNTVKTDLEIAKMMANAENPMKAGGILKDAGLIGD
jgi:hypothetical protein